jgi:hypothetical protein
MAEAYKKPAGVHAYVLRSVDPDSYQCTKCGKRLEEDVTDEDLMAPCNPPVPPKPKGAA